MANTLTSAQRQELKDAFDVFDTGKCYVDLFDTRCCSVSLDGSGRISSQELGNIFQALNIKATKNQLDRFVSQMDSNRSGECVREGEEEEWTSSFSFRSN